MKDCDCDLTGAGGGLAHGFAGRKKRRYYVVEKGPKAGRLEPSRYCRQGLRVWHLMPPVVEDLRAERDSVLVCAWQVQNVVSINKYSGKKKLLPSRRGKGGDG